MAMMRTFSPSFYPFTAWFLLRHNISQVLISFRLDGTSKSEIVFLHLPGFVLTAAKTVANEYVGKATVRNTASLGRTSRPSAWVLSINREEQLGGL